MCSAPIKFVEIFGFVSLANWCGPSTISLSCYLQFGPFPSIFSFVVILTNSVRVSILFSLA